MQLLLVRHALPLRSDPGQGADPDLSAAGREQAERLPAALARYPIARLVSSPQRRAVQTAEPAAAARGVPIDIDERFAEYDRNLHAYVPIEQIRDEQPEAWARMSAGHLPPGV
ncbi:histidine phosphatase family protein, partial [Mycolicibacterium hippocampi]